MFWYIAHDTLWPYEYDVLFPHPNPHFTSFILVNECWLQLCLNIFCTVAETMECGILKATRQMDCQVTEERQCERAGRNERKDGEGVEGRKGKTEGERQTKTEIQRQRERLRERKVSVHTCAHKHTHTFTHACILTPLYAERRSFYSLLLYSNATR